MFWILFFLIALLALAYRRAGTTTSAWVLGGAIVFFGLLGHSIGFFILFVLIWVVVFTPLLVPALRQEWLSRPAFNRFRQTLQTLPPETASLLEADKPGCDAPLLDGAPDWAMLFAIAVPTLDENQQAWLQAVVDPACAKLVDAPGDAQAKRQLSAAALGLSPCTPDNADEGADGGAASDASPTTNHDDAATAALRSAVCARTAGVLGIDAWTWAAPLRAGWLALLREEARDGTARAWLAQAETDPAILAVTHSGLDASRVPAAVATIATDGDDAGPCIRLNLCCGLQAPNAAAHYALLVEFRDGSPSARGSACIVIDAATPGLRATRTRDGRTILAGDAIRAPLSALIGGARHIGRGEHRLTAAMAAARAIHAPALHLGLTAPLALAAALHARLHAPFERPLTRHGAVRRALADIAADLYAANALRELALAQLDRNSAPIGLAAITEFRIAALAERIAGNSRSLDGDGVLASLASRNAAGVSALAATQLGMRSLGRCHPQLRRQIEAAQDLQPALALEAFDAALWAHVGHLLSNAVRSLLASFGAGALIRTQGITPGSARCLRRIDRASTNLALLVDLMLFARGRSLMHSDRLLGAAGDALSQLQLARAALWKTQSTPGPATQALLRLAVRPALEATQDNLDTLLNALPGPLRALARILTSPLGRTRLSLHEHDDAVATTWLCDGNAATQFAALISDTPPAPLPELRRALDACRAGEALATRIENTGKPADGPLERIAAAEKTGRIDAVQAEQLRGWLRLCGSIAHSEPAAADA